MRLWFSTYTKDWFSVFSVSKGVFGYL
uniref:Uncharacterized protein n=1 Tax=Arundo donax TaxID=35708 RepID=A0A0A9CGQ6_ARUDO